MHLSLRYLLLLPLILPWSILIGQVANVRVGNRATHQSEMAIAVSPVDSKLVLAAWNDQTNSIPSPGYAFSTDGGLNWNADILDNLVNAADPSVAFDPIGFAYYCYVNRSDGDVFVARSSDLGINWEHYGVSLSSDLMADKPYLTADNTSGMYSGHLYATWDIGYPVRFKYSPDQGAHWYPEGVGDTLTNGFLPGVREVPSYESGPDFDQCAIPAVGPDGDVWVVFSEWSATGENSQIRMRHLTNGGQALDPAVYTVATYDYFPNRSVGNYHIYAFPTIAVDQSSGRFYVAYQELVGSQVKIKLAVSPDSVNWVVLDGYVGDLGVGTWQFHPWIAVDKTGKATVFFLGSLDGSTINSYVTESFDGYTFSSPIRVSSQPFSASDPGIVGNEYQSASAGDCHVHALWTDTREGGIAKPFTAVAAGTPSSTSYAATRSGVSPKSAYVSSNASWQSVHVSNGRVYSTYSTNEGSAWTGFGRVSSSLTGLEESSNPTLVTRNGVLHCVFKRLSSGIYYNRGTASGIWETVKLLSTLSVREITFAVDGAGTGHVVVAYDNQALAGMGPDAVTYYIKHGTFNTALPTPTLSTLTTVRSSTAQLSSPTLALDAQNKPHVCWRESGEIWYSNKVSGSWSTRLNVSNTSGSSESPSLWMIGSTGYLAWQDNLSGNYEILYRSRFSSGTWSDTSNVSRSSGSSIEPHIEGSVLNQPVIVWADATTGNYDIRYHLPLSTTSGSFKTTPGPSHYPTLTTRSVGSQIRILASWTDGSQAPYKVEHDYQDVAPQLGKEGATGGGRSDAGAAEFELFVNYPNPFNPSTTIRYALPERSYVTLTVFNTLGQLVATLVEGEMEPGYHDVRFDGSQFASGVYLYRLQAGDLVQTRKWLLIK